MATLIVSTPVNPIMKDRPGRFKLKVRLDNGHVIGLPDMAERLKIPYPTLHRAIFMHNFPLGEHRQEFLEIIADCRRRATKRKPRGVVCPTCAGSGRLAREAHDVVSDV